MEQTIVNIRMDKSKKAQLDTVADLMGITTSGLINIFINRVVFEKKLPFPLEVPVNTWYHRENESLNKMLKANIHLAKKYNIKSDEQIVAEMKKIRRGQKL